MIKHLKLTAKKISKLATAIIIVLTLIIMICVFLFLYKNFYQTITQTEEVLMLGEKIIIDKVNMEKFNLVIDKLTKKTIVPEELKNIYNPFK